MTFRELYLTARQELTRAGVDAPAFDAAALIAHFFGLDRPGLALRGTEEAPEETGALFLQAVRERAERRPLQYILGRWEFLGLSLKTGEGVLAPREDTAVLVETAARLLKNVPAPQGLDLCAGTGAVGLGLCSRLPQANVVCVELSEAAFSYLEENLAAYPDLHVRSLRGDVLSPETAKQFPPESLDFILSNPPYVAEDEIPSLQAEVLREPLLAVNGGKDGLVFYRALVSHWLSRLKPGGLLAVEIGETQGAAVGALFTAHGLEDVRVEQDLAGLDRCVTGRRAVYNV